MRPMRSTKPGKTKVKKRSGRPPTVQSLVNHNVEGKFSCQGRGSAKLLFLFISSEQNRSYCVESSLELFNQTTPHFSFDLVLSGVFGLDPVDEQTRSP